jgi:glycosyltransferase involved in cell wall biosynthesis
VIPYYRARQTIARAIRSVLAQTVHPHEILVVDDGSLDDLTEALKEFGSAVTLISKSNGGAASARNVGVDHAHGEWIAFLDADDYWEPSKLERQLAYSEGVGMVGGRWYTEYPGKPRRIENVPDDGFFGRIISATGSEVFHVAMNIWTGTVLVRRSLLGDRRFVPGLETAEDRDLWIRLASSTPIYLLVEPLATYVQYDNSLSNSDSDRDYGNMLSVVRHYADLLGPKGVREQEAEVYRRWAHCNLGRGRPRSAVTPAVRWLAMQPASPRAWWIMCKSVARSVLI